MPRPHCCDAPGVVLVFMLQTVSGQANLVLLDGDRLGVVANITLPIAPLVSAGLHNHWPNFPTSV